MTLESVMGERLVGEKLQFYQMFYGNLEYVSPKGERFLAHANTEKKPAGRLYDTLPHFAEHLSGFRLFRSNDEAFFKRLVEKFELDVASEPLRYVANDLIVDAQREFVKAFVAGKRTGRNWRRNGNPRGKLENRGFRFYFFEPNNGDLIREY